MPPRQAHKAAAPPSKSRELVTTGPKELVAKKYHGKRDENGQRPTTSRALMLRNGKHGSMGTGEVVLSNRISGREKLELLAGTVDAFALLWSVPLLISRAPGRGSLEPLSTGSCNTVQLRESSQNH